MKILQLCSYYDPHIGGIEQVAEDCSNVLSEKHEVKVVCFNHEKGNKTDEINGVEVVRAGCFAKVSSQSLSCSYGKLLKKTVKDFDPDVIFFHYPNPFIALFLLKALKKRPQTKLVLYWHLDITKQKLLGKLFKNQTKKLLKRANAVIATSPNYIDGSPYLSAFREKCVVIPNCANIERVTLTDEEKAASEALKKENANKTVLFALGRHIPYKGMEYLVKASKYLDDNFVVNIGGEGPLTEELKKLAAGDEKVHFLGKLPLSDLRVQMNACDIFCFPSVTKNEAFGIALAEAMYFAKPAVTFTIEGSGVNYVSIDGETGLQAKNADAEDYANAIKRLAEDKELRIRFGESAKSRVENLFTSKQFKENINVLLSSLF